MPLLRVEMKAPTITAATPMTGILAAVAIVGNGVGVTAAVAGMLMAAAGWCR